MILARLIGQEIKIRYLWFGLGRSFFSRALPQAAIAEYDLKLLVYDPTNQVIVEWID